MGRIFAQAALACLCSVAIASDGETAERGSDSDAPRVPLAAAGAEFNAPTGFTVSVIASDPDVVNPASMCTDPAGRIYIGEDYVHAKIPGRKTDDVKVFIGAEKGGKPTESKIIASDLGSVQGLAFYKDTLYISHTPHLTAIKINPDGSAGERKDLFSGIGIVGAPKASHCSTGLTVFEGKIYLTFGDQGCDFTTKENRRIKLDCGAVVRFDPDGGNAEVYAHGLRNIYQIAFDPNGNGFARDNTNDGGGYNVRSYFIMKGGYFGWPFRWREGDANPPAPDVLTRERDQGGGSPTGSYYLSAPAFPEPYRGSALFCEWGRGLIVGSKPVRSGSGFDLPEYVLLAQSKSASKGEKGHAFRPVAIDTLPDQSLVIADWGSSSLYPTEAKGRLLRLKYTGKMPQDVPPDSVTLAAAQAAELRINTADDVLKSKLISANPLVRSRAAFLLGEHKAESAKADLQRLLNDQDAMVRLQTAIALGDYRDVALIPTFVGAYCKESDRRVKNLLLRGMKETGRWREIIAAIKEAPETFRPDLLYSVREIFDAELAKSLCDLARDTQQPAALRVTAVKWVGLIARQASKRWPWGDKPVLTQALRDTDWDGTKPCMDLLYETARSPVAELRHPAIRALAELRDMTLIDTLLEAVRKGEIKLNDETAAMLAALPGNVKAVHELTRYVPEGKSSEVRLEVLGTLAAMDDPVALDGLRKALYEWNLPPELSAEAIQGLARKKDAQSLPKLRELLTTGAPPVQSASARALGLLCDVSSVPALEKVADAGDRALKSQALAALWRITGDKQPDGFTRRLYAIPATDDTLQSELLAVLENTGQKDRAEPVLLGWLKYGTPSKNTEEGIVEYMGKMTGTSYGYKPTGEARRQALLKFAARLNDKFPKWQPPGGLQTPAAPVSDDDADAKLATLAKQAMLGGDPSKGAAVFRNIKGANCINCHRIGTEGARIGPELTEVGGKYPRAALIESVLYPSKQLLDGYEMTLLALKSGERLPVIIQAEDDTKLTVVRSDGTKMTVAAADIVKRVKSKESLMPEGLANTMSGDDFVNLIAYLESLKKTGL